MLLAEVNDIASRLPEYFGDNNRMNVLFNFLLNQHMFLALARENAVPVEEEMKKLPTQPNQVSGLIFFVIMMNLLLIN